MPLRSFLPLGMFLAGVVLPVGCSCEPTPLPPPPALIACRPQHPTRPTAPAAEPEVETAAVGAVPVTFSTTSTGEATLQIPLRPVPGRGAPPTIALTYSSAGGDGVLGAGFAITGSSVITRCPKDLRDGEIRDVRYDAQDKLCLDGRSLVVVGQEAGSVEYRTVPDTTWHWHSITLAGGAKNQVLGSLSTTI